MIHLVKFMLKYDKFVKYRIFFFLKTVICFWKSSDAGC